MLGGKRLDVHVTKQSTSVHHLVGVGKYGTIGLDFALPVVLGMYLGWWLDRKYGFSPWLTISGTALGVAVGINLLVKTVKELNRQLEREEFSTTEGHADRSQTNHERE